MVSVAAVLRPVVSEHSDLTGEPKAKVRSVEDQVIERMKKLFREHPPVGKNSARELYEFEKRLHEEMLQMQRDVLGEVLSASDVDADAIEIEGKVHRRVLRSSQTYMTSAGEVVVERWLYKDRSDPEGKAVAPLDLRVGMVEGFWTQRAAEQGCWVVSQMTPAKAEELFDRVGNMTPSKSSLDRLPKAISERWEQNREAHEQVLREALVVPEGTHSIAVSIDGVMAPVDGGKNPVEVRNKAAAAGRLTRGPAGYRELGCATISFCDEQGELISAIRFGRAPEAKKASLKDTLRKDLAHILSQHPHLRLAKIADAGGDNWQYLSSLPEGPEILDFFHACEHLSAAIASVHGDGTTKTRLKFEDLKDRLLNNENGAKSVINALSFLHRTHPEVERVATELRYFRKNRKRMSYARWRAEGYMIGSGIVEAACKTLVAQRLKLSGMRWGSKGAQGILTLRGWDQSERFDTAWALVAATYERKVHVLANIIDLSQRSKTGSRRKGTSG